MLIIASLLTLLSLGVGGFLLSALFGPLGMAWMNLLPLGMVVLVWAVHRIDPPMFWDLGRSLIWVYVVPLPLFALVVLVAPAGSLERLILSGLASLVSLALFARRYFHDFRCFLTEEAGG